MRQLIPVVFVGMSFLSVFSTGTAHTMPVTQDQMVLQATPAPISTAATEPSIPARTGPPLSLTLLLLGMCCVFGLFGGVVVLGFIARNPKNKEANHSR
jgi:hypothetical protein